MLGLPHGADSQAREAHMQPVMPESALPAALEPSAAGSDVPMKTPEYIVLVKSKCPSVVRGQIDALRRSQAFRFDREAPRNCHAFERAAESSSLGPYVAHGSECPSYGRRPLRDAHCRSERSTAGIEASPVGCSAPTLTVIAT